MLPSPARAKREGLVARRLSSRLPGRLPICRIRRPLISRDRPFPPPPPPAWAAVDNLLATPVTSLLPTPARDPHDLDYYGTNGDGSMLLRGIRGARAAVRDEALRDAASERCGSSEPDAGADDPPSGDEAATSGSDSDPQARAADAGEKDERARLLALVEAQAIELRQLRARIEAIEATVGAAAATGATASHASHAAGAAAAARVERVAESTPAP